MQVGRRRSWCIDTGENGHCHQRYHGLHDEAECEQIGRPDIHRPLHELRTEDAGEYAACHHPRDGLGANRYAGAVGGRKAIGL